MSRPERRSCERFPVEGGTVDWEADTHPGQLASECAIGDLSRGGVRLLTTGAPSKGTVVGVTLHVPGEPEPLRLRGTVVRTQVSSGQLHDMAVAFAPYTSMAGDNDTAALDRLVVIEARCLGRANPND
jgi:hypothetical protein